MAFARSSAAAAGTTSGRASSRRTWRSRPTTNIARGMSAAEARDAARRKLGNTTLIREEIYRMNTIGLPRQRLARSALRRAAAAPEPGVRDRRDPVARARRRRQHRNLPAARRPPHPHAAGRAARAARWRSASRGAERPTGQSFNGRHADLTNPLWERIRDRQEAFSSVFAWAATDVRPEHRRRESRQCDGLVGERRVLQHARRAPDARARAHACGRSARLRGAARVISYGFWQREYGGSASALGRTLTLDGHPFEIVGITPPGFFGVEVGRALRRRGAAVRGAALARRAHRTWTGTMAGSSPRSAA